MLGAGVTTGVVAAEAGITGAVAAAATTGAAAGTPGGFHSFAVGFGFHSLALARRADFFFSASAAAAAVDDDGARGGVFDVFDVPDAAAACATAAAAMAAFVAAGTNAGAFVDTLMRDPLLLLLTAVRGASLTPVVATAAGTGTDAALGVPAADGGGVGVAAAAAPPPAFGDWGTGVALGFAAGERADVAGVAGVVGVVAGAGVVARAAAAAVEAAAGEAAGGVAGGVAEEAAGVAAAAAAAGPFSLFEGGVGLNEQTTKRNAAADAQKKSANQSKTFISLTLGQRTSCAKKKTRMMWDGSGLLFPLFRRAFPSTFSAIAEYAKRQRFYILHHQPRYIYTYITGK